ncbi:hypothetical protein LJT19_004317 [Salmonella enterica]|nr:hypothetical protein [Salmonella enterica]
MSDNTLPATAGATQALISLIMLAQRVQRACVYEQRTNRLPAWLEQAFPADHTRGKTA